MNNSNNIILGDIHGNTDIIKKYLYRGVLDNSNLYQIGDFGFGFRAITEDILNNLNEELESHNTNLFIIRGNHDDPEFWLDDDKRNEFNDGYSNITLLPDYHSEIIGGKSVLFIGGSVSIDKYRRIDNSSGKVEGWWEDEGVTQPPSNLSEHDVVIAHGCPSFFNVTSEGEGAKPWIDRDPEIKKELDDERELLDSVFHTVKPKEWFSGHYHNRLQDKKHGCSYKCLDINELFEFRNNTHSQ